MLANGSGSIIFNSSIASLAGDVSQFSYGGAKAAVNWYVRAIAANYGPRGVRCNGILPGVIKTVAQSAWVTPEIDAVYLNAARPPRSEARRGGKEWVSTCRSRWAPYT